MNLNESITAVLLFEGRPLGALLGTPRAEVKLMPPLHTGIVEAWSNAHGELSASGVSAHLRWELDDEQSLLATARADLTAKDPEALKAAVVAFYEAKLGKPKKGAKPSWSVTAGLPATLTVSTPKRFPSNVVVELAVAKGTRLQRPEEPQRAPSVVPAALLELVTAQVPLGAKLGAKVPEGVTAVALPASSGPFPSKAELKPALTKGKLYALELTFPDFASESAHLEVFETLLEAMSAKLGKAKLSKKTSSTETRRAASWAVDGHPLTLWSWDLWNEGNNIRQVGVEYRDCAHAGL